jgi:hypothetical protein
MVQIRLNPTGTKEFPREISSLIQHGYNFQGKMQ